MPTHTRLDFASHFASRDNFLVNFNFHKLIKRELKKCRKKFPNSAHDLDHVKSFTMIGKLSSRRFAFHFVGLLIIFHIVDRDDDEKNRFQFTRVLQLETNNCAVLVEVY